MSARHARSSSLRIVLFLACGALALAGCGTAEPRSTGEGDDPEAPRLSVMSWNLYLGAELDPAIQALVAGDLDGVVAAITQVWAEVRGTDFRLRAEALAAQIAGAHPDVLALQEAALWRSQVPSDVLEAMPAPAEHVEFDFVQILLDALALRGTPYVVLASLETADAEFPALTDDFAGLQDVRFTDREVILGRADLALDDVLVSDAFGALFDTNLVLPGGLGVLRGWVCVDLEVEGRPVRVVSSHLDADVPEIQEAQAAELLAGPLTTAGDVLLVGDLNSDALGGPGATATYGNLLAAGLSDAWSLLHPVEPGATWGHDALLADPGALHTQRLDLALLRGALDPVSAVLHGLEAQDVGGGMVWASDHAGLLVEFELP